MRTKNSSFHRTVKNCSVERSGDMVTVTIEADGFLYNMVRIMSGTLLYAGIGKLSTADIEALFENPERQNAGKTLPPEGLTLEEVFYDWEKWKA